MSLNIKNTEADRLAHELADLTGESLTEAVTVALRERLEKLQRESEDDLVEKVMALAKDTAKHFREPFVSTDHADMLYDERGLPK